MGMTASDLLDRLQKVLQDANEDRWTRADLLQYLSDAQQEVVGHRPDANAEVRNILLVEGSLQEIPADAHAFLGGVRNMGSDGLTPGRAIKNMLLAEKESSDPAWEDGLESATVRETVYDSMTPRHFWASPMVPALPAVYIAARLSILPDDLALEADILPLSVTYREPIIRFAAAMAFDENTDAGSSRRAAQYRAEAMQLLGVRNQADQKITRSVSGPVDQ